MLTQTSLLDIVKERLASGRLQLPVLAPSALELQNMLVQDDADFDEIVPRIMQDQALAGQVLRVANSAFYGGLKQVSTIKDAILRLGTKEITNLVLLTTQQESYGCRDDFLKPYVGSLWKHAAGCAHGSKWLANKLGYESLSQEAFLAGLLHDIGKLFLLKVLESIHASHERGASMPESVLGEILDSLHHTQGELLLRKWNLPEIYCDVARLHEDENYDFGNTVVTIVRLANMACHKLGIGLKSDPSIVLATTKEVSVLQVSEVHLAELEILLEDAMSTTTEFR
jgi:HD-like signal output (HDOD) protein